MGRLAHLRGALRSRSKRFHPAGSAVDEACDDAELPAEPPWTLTVRHWPALARTEIVLAGAADEAAVAALVHEIAQARERDETITLDLGRLTSCPPDMPVRFWGMHRLTD